MIETTAPNKEAGVATTSVTNQAEANKLVDEDQGNTASQVKESTQ